MATPRLIKLASQYRNVIDSTKTYEFIEWIMNVAHRMTAPSSSEIDAKFSIARVCCNDGNVLTELRNELDSVLSVSTTPEVVIPQTNPQSIDLFNLKKCVKLNTPGAKQLYILEGSTGAIYLIVKNEPINIGILSRDCRSIIGDK